MLSESTSIEKVIVRRERRPASSLRCFFVSENDEADSNCDTGAWAHVSVAAQHGARGQDADHYEASPAARPVQPFEPLDERLY